MITADRVRHQAEPERLFNEVPQGLTCSLGLEFALGEQVIVQIDRGS